MVGMQFLIAMVLVLSFGCSKPAPIEVYTIPTKLPETLLPDRERMLAAMFPKEDDVWFFKVTGPEKAINQIDSTFRQFVRDIQFLDAVPDLTDLPEGWRQGGKKQFRFASIIVETPEKQLDISVSKLPLQEDWDEQVKMNVNRWRGQLKLPSSDEKWASGQQMKVSSADSDGVWVELIGDPASTGTAMVPPLVGSSSSAASPRPAGSGRTEATARGNPGQGSERLKFERPEGWRDGRMTSMRMAAFSAGPEDAPAELTVISAGGDLRGNVARWLGQVRKDVPSEVVDQAMADAQRVKVDGRSGQRFFLSDEDATTGQAIDATIIPLEGGLSVFVKMTGPAQTVTDQKSAITSFLDSLELKL